MFIVKLMRGGFALLFVLYSTTVMAQGGFNLEHVSTNNGMSSNFVTDILLDSNSSIWISTQAGLSVYNGLAHEVSAFPKVASQRVIMLEMNRSGCVVAYTTKSKVTVCSEDDSVLIEDIDYVSNDIFRRINNNNLPLFNEHYNIDSFKGVLKINKIELASFSGDFHFNRGAFTDEGLLMIGKNGVFIFSGRANIAYRQIPNFNPERVISVRDKIYYINEDGAIIALAKPGNTVVGHLNTNTKKGYKVLNSDKSTVFFVVNDNIYSFVLENAGKVKTRHLFTIKNAQEIVTRVLCLRDDAYVVSTLNNGVYIARSASVTKSFLNDTSVHYSLLMMPDDRTVYSVSANRFYSEGRSSQYSLQNHPQYAYVDSQGFLWYVLSSNDSTYIFSKSLSDNKEQLVAHIDGVVSNIFEDDVHCIWFIGNSGIVVWSNGHIRKVVSYSLDKTVRVVNSLFLNDSSFLMTTGAGLYRLNLRNKKIENILAPHTEFRGILSISDSLTILTTYGNGIYCYSGDSLIKLPLDRKSRLLYTHDVIRVNDTGLLFVTNTGILYTLKSNIQDWVTRKHGPIGYYNLSDRYDATSIEYNGGVSPLVAINHTGNLYLPSNNGIRSVILDSLLITYPDSFIRINEVSVSGRKMKHDSVVIPAHIERVDLALSDVFWGNADNLEYDYAFLGSSKNEDTAWITLNDYVIRMLNFKYGNYTLLIRKRVSVKNGGYSYKRIYVEKLPYWYETIWLTISLVCVALLIAFAYYKNRRARIIRQNNKLKERIKDATTSLRRRNYINNKLLHVFSHDIAGSLSATKMAIKLTMIGEEKATVSSIVDSLDKLENYIDNLLQWLSTDRENFVLQNDYYDLKSIVENAFSTASIYSQVYSVSVRTSNIQKDLRIYTDKRILEIILVNIFSNAIKYTKNGSVDVYVEIFEGGIKLMIDDDGPGFPEEVLKWIDGSKNKNGELMISVFNRTNRSGLGIDIIMDMSSLLNVKVFFNNKRNSNGAIVTLILPL